MPSERKYKKESHLYLGHSNWAADPGTRGKGEVCAGHLQTSGRGSCNLGAGPRPGVYVAAPGSCENNKGLMGITNNKWRILHKRFYMFFSQSCYSYPYAINEAINDATIICQLDSFLSLPKGQRFQWVIFIQCQ